MIQKITDESISQGTAKEVKVYMFGFVHFIDGFTNECLSTDKPGGMPWANTSHNAAKEGCWQFIMLI